MRKIAQASSGFLYMVSLTGVTGVRAQLPAELQQHLRTRRGITTKPICVGFGIGTPEQAAAVGQAADGVIVASAIVQLVEKHAGQADLVTRIGDFIASLKEPLRLARSDARA
jgi:tryptophan synthase alpha chain